VLHYQKGSNSKVSYGLIKAMKNNNIAHLCCTDSGLSGSPILSLDNFKVIALHFGSNKNYDYNLSKFIKIILNSFSQAIKEENAIYKIQGIFQSNEFNDLSEDEFIKKYQHNQKLIELKTIQFDLHSDFKFTKNILDYKGNKISGCRKGEKRGGKDYIPPLGWKGFGFNAFDKYDDNLWIGKNNSNGE